KLLKERAEKIELGSGAHESLQIEKDKPSESAGKPKKTEEVRIKSIITHGGLAKEEKEKLSGPKIVGKIDLKASTKEEKKKTTPETSPAPEIEKPAKEENTAKEEKPAEEENSIEKIETSITSLNGPKVIGKIELPVSKPSKKLVASSSDSFKPKKKKKTIRIHKEEVKSSEKTKTQDIQKDKRSKKVRVDQKEASHTLKATLAKLENKKSSKRKRQQRKNENGEEEIEEDNRIKVTEFITVNELATLMEVNPTEVIMACMNLGVMVTMNQRLDAELIELVTEEFGFEIEFIDIKDQEEDDDDLEDGADELKERPSIVTIMGHVDHGKTSLLDYIRKENVIAGEAGGITQHIGAYSVTLENGKEITFLDTPGHEAFTAMRARGAKVTDIAVIVIAADDSIMPQTKEAISHAQAAGVSMIFAINKMDKPDANAEKIKEQLAGMDLLVEDWGGSYQCQEISAKSGTNIDVLLEKILIDTELQELKANPDRNAMGTVIEASLDKGKGYVATLLVQNGTLKIGDMVLAGPYYGKVKALSDERGNRSKYSGPSKPAQVLGLNGAPQAGDKFKVYNSEQDAKQIAFKRHQIIREQGIRTNKHITLDEIGRRLALGNFQELNIILKGDVDGSVEALSNSLLKLSTDEVKISIIHKGVGQITESDILLASASDALVVGFQVRPSSGARKLAQNE
ncbi:MAG TPA: translation initiation factor IF-2, partial [Bacteroidetes bacterium]|nr:translation initiation factor IF-2 [Bacteroidota bacterium]